MSRIERKIRESKEWDIENVPTEIYYEMILKLIDEGETVDTARGIVNDANWYFDLPKEHWDDRYCYRNINQFVIEF